MDKGGGRLVRQVYKVHQVHQVAKVFINKNLYAFKSYHNYFILIL